MEIEEVRQFLKRNFSGPGVLEALRFRLETHLKDPMLDPLSRQVWEGYLELPRHLEEPFSLLDAGCMSGFLYHHLKKYFRDFTYTGLDRWQEALQVGREYAPEIQFIRKDFMEDDLSEVGEFDYIVVSNIPFKNGKEVDRAIEQLRPHRRKRMFIIYPDSTIHSV